jgi:hypothetical protein
MNSNLFHNILSLLLLVLGAVATFDWTTLGASADVAIKITGGIVMATSILKLGVNVSRDGLTGLTKPQPPVGKG